MGNSKKVIFISLIIFVVLSAAVWFALSYGNVSREQALVKQEKSGAIQNETVQEQAVEVPQTNPFEEAKTNPFTDIKTNPFE